MAYIGKQPVIGNFQKCDSIAVVNGQAAYTLQVGGSNVSPQSENHMLVSLNGILQAPTDSFTVSGSTITFASALSTGDVIDFVMILGNVLDLGVPSDNTVSTAKIVDGAITSAKLGSGVGGKILQVQVNPNNILSQVSTNSTTFVDVNDVDVTLTPASTSSKIVIWSNFHFDSGGTNQGISGRLTYNHSGISQTEVDPSYDDYAMTSTVGGSRIAGWYTMMNYLAPNTTNEITFRMQFASAGSYSTYFDRKTLRIIAMEYSS